MTGSKGRGGCWVSALVTVLNLMIAGDDAASVSCAGNCDILDPSSGTGNGAPHS